MPQRTYILTPEQLGQVLAAGSESLSKIPRSLVTRAALTHVENGSILTIHFDATRKISDTQDAATNPPREENPNPKNQGREALDKDAHPK